jgi:hypothetical protein
MALKLATTHIWVNFTDAYYKITITETKETWISQWQVKQYSTELTVNCYTDSTKAYNIGQKTYTFPDLTESDFTYPKAYICLKWLDEFTWAVDV